MLSPMLCLRNRAGMSLGGGIARMGKTPDPENCDTRDHRPGSCWGWASGGPFWGQAPSPWNIFPVFKANPLHPRLKISLMQSPLPTSSCLFIQKWQLKLSINIVSSVSKDVIQEFPPEYRHSSVQKNTVPTEGAKIITKKYSCFNPLLSVLM